MLGRCMAKKIAIVTALIGAYDATLPNFKYDSDKYDVICYTNMKRLKSSTWDIRVVDELVVEGDNAKSSYYYKWNPHKYLNHDDYDTMVWVDCSFDMFNVDTLQEFIDRLEESDNSLYIEKHPLRSTLADELHANSSLEKDDVDVMRAQVERYFKEGYPESYTIMVETGLSIRKYKDEKLIEFSESIWDEMVPDGNTKRDQLVFDYCMWKHDFKDNVMLFTYDEKCTVVLFKNHPNRPEHKTKCLVVGPWFGDFRYEKEWVKYVRAHLEKTPVDMVVVGCRTGREDLYGDLADKFIVSNPEGDVNGNLLDGKVPRFDIKSTDDKQIIRLSPSNTIFNIIKARTKKKLVVSLSDMNFKDGCTIGNGDLKEYTSLSNLYWDRSDNVHPIHIDTDIAIGRSNVRGETNVAMLVEPEEFDRLHQVHSIPRLDLTAKNYDYVLTYDGSVLEGPHKDKAIFYPYGGCWIKPEDFKVYDKTKSVSMISSNKNLTSGHLLRLKILRELGDTIGDLYGRDTNPIDYKLEALKDYKFSVVVESCSKNYYFTEKLIDCLVTGTVPIYWGCPAIGDYFDIDGFLVFNNVDELKSILEMDLDAEYEKRKDAIVRNFQIAQSFTITENNVYKALMGLGHED